MANEPIAITDAELEIMKVLWRKGSATSPEIFADIEDGKSRNKSTLKTLLLRLVQKEAVAYELINARNYRYRPLVSEAEYIRHNRRNFLDKLFDGSAKKMLLNFVQEEKLTKEDLLELIDRIEVSKDE